MVESPRNKGASAGILSGIRVLDFSRMLSGPYCTMMLADHGAEVIKVEAPEGDTSRSNGPYRSDDPERQWAGYFVSLNRSKKSVVLNLKTPEGRDAVRRLLKSTDVLVENFRPGVMDRLGLGFEELAKENPKLVYAAIRGFGDPRTGESPYSNWPSYDVVAQAMGGLMSITGKDSSSPMKTGPGIGDIFAGLMMSFAIVAAVRHAEATGHGQFIDIAMYDAVLSLCERLVYQYDMEGISPAPVGNGHPLLAPFGLFPALDGWISIGVVDDGFWQELARVMDRADLARDSRFANKHGRREQAAEVNEAVAKWTRQYSKLELAQKLGGKLPFGPVNNAKDIFMDPHVAARGMIAEVQHAVAGHRPWRVAANPIRFSRTPAIELRTPPALGADNEVMVNIRQEAISLAEPFDTRGFRRALGQFATGVTIITTIEPNGIPRGFTANSFSSVSLDPPLLLVCIARSAASCSVFCTAQNFAINILSENQKDISGLFATQRPEKFNIASWRCGSAGTPLITGALAWFECEHYNAVSAGDHVILIGLVKNFGYSDGRPLGYLEGRYFTLGLEDPLIEAAGRGAQTIVGAIYENEGAVMLEVDSATGQVRIPAVDNDGKPPNVFRLAQRVKGQNTETSIDFVYAVFEDRNNNTVSIYYRGHAEGPPPAGMAYFKFSEIPWAGIRDGACRSMLERYVSEAKQGSFALYMGNETEGVVRSVV